MVLVLQLLAGHRDGIPDVAVVVGGHPSSAGPGRCGRGRSAGGGVLLAPSELAGRTSAPTGRSLVWSELSHPRHRLSSCPLRRPARHRKECLRLEDQPHPARGALPPDALRIGGFRVCGRGRAGTSPICLRWSSRSPSASMPWWAWLPPASWPSPGPHGLWLAATGSGRSGIGLSDRRWST